MLGTCSRTTNGLPTATAPGRKVGESLAIPVLPPAPLLPGTGISSQQLGPHSVQLPASRQRSHPEVGPRVDKVAPAGQLGDPNLPSIGAERPAESAGRAKKA